MCITDGDKVGCDEGIALGFFEGINEITWDGDELGRNEAIPLGSSEGVNE